MDYGDLPAAVQVRVSIYIRHASVCRPSGMAEYNITFRHIRHIRRSDLPDLFFTTMVFSCFYLRFVTFVF